jgi:hypothetical protein
MVTIHKLVRMLTSGGKSAQSTTSRLLTRRGSMSSVVCRMRRGMWRIWGPLCRATSRYQPVYPGRLGRRCQDRHCCSPRRAYSAGLITAAPLDGLTVPDIDDTNHHRPNRIYSKLQPNAAEHSPKHSGVPTPINTPNCRPLQPQHSPTRPERRPHCGTRRR